MISQTKQERPGLFNSSFFFKNGLKLKFAVQGDYSEPLGNQG